MDSTEHAPGEPRVHLDEQGILCIDFSDCSRITREAVEFANRRHRELSPTRPSPVLVLSGQVGRVEYPAQRYASSPEVSEKVAAMALVTHSFLQRHLARMFLMYHRPSYPVQLFADEPAARAWLARQSEARA